MGKKIAINALLFWPAIALLGAMAYRAYSVEGMLGDYTRCQGCFVEWTLISDATVVAAIFTLLWLSFWAKQRVIRLSLRMTALLVTLLYLADIVAIKLFNSRLNSYDIKTYFDPSTVVEFLHLDTRLLLLLCLIMVTSAIVLILWQHSHRGLKYLTGLLAMISWGASAIPIKESYVHDVYYRNFISVNLDHGSSKSYSTDYIAALDRKYPNSGCTSCEFSDATHRPNVIVLVVESLSMYHSQLFSGINDWTPNIDAIAKENRYFTNFHANTFRSSHGLIALASGYPTMVPIKPFLQQKPVEGYRNIDYTLPKFLSAVGYETAFLKAGVLSSSDSDLFAQSMGFDVIEGSEYPGYQGADRYQFDSVEDLVFYRRVVDYAQTAQAPYFVMAVTVTSHLPFVVPKTRELDQEKTMRYVDTAVKTLYDDLVKNNFFEDGVLIITADHRAMTPISAAEIDQFGLGAASLVPLIVVGGDFSSGAQTALVQQNDLLNSLVSWLSPDCEKPHMGSFLREQPKSAQCVYHSRGDRRDAINVFCGQESGAIKFAGDDTRLVSGRLTDESDIIDYVNFRRIQLTRRAQAEASSAEVSNVEASSKVTRQATFANEICF
ncbi:LTA synthase family protein [Ostreibacterium oceani]|uniref:LTA synthase family protein n=1 Tax=Ostreibacterium oceani TaxID=2654998 RepID=UPI001C403ED4|nr:LTA synthase family protein [Ostreibacterium oceani]